jgi:hypothetical protein
MFELECTMDAEQLNQTAATLADLRKRLIELRGYL